MNVEDDRISRLPDDLIHEILSFISIHDAIKTSLLSTRWRYLWTSIPYLNFLEDDFYHRNPYSDFVVNALSRRNNQVQVCSFKLMQRWLKFSHDFLKRIVNYAASHNVQQLSIDTYQSVLFPATWELPALTTLHLDYVTLSDKHHKCIDLISKCANLKNLTLSEFKTEEAIEALNIFHPQLSTLTITNTLSYVRLFNVVTPQLKNLTITCISYAKHMISAPELTSLVLRGDHPVELSTEGFPFLEMLDLDIFRTNLTMVHKMVCLLQQFHTVKFFKTNLEVLQLLSSSTEGISYQSCAFSNLKISKFLTVLTGKVYMEAQEKVVTMTTTESKSLVTSPSAIFTMVSCEEIEVMRKLVSAEKLIKYFPFSVGSCKRKRGKVQVKKQCVQSEFEMQWHFGEMMAQIEQEKIDGLLSKKFPLLETRNMISSLQDIAGLLTELPASKRSALQATFSGMCEKAAILMNKMMHGTKKKRSSSARKLKLNQDP